MPRVSDFMILKQTDQNVMTIRKKTNIAQIPEILGNSFQELSAYINKADEILTDIPYVAYHGFESMDENNTDIEIGFPVSKLLDGTENIKPRIIPECKIVMCIYRGDNNEIGAVYEEMLKWAKDKGYKITGDCYEYYLNGPPFPIEEMLTKIVLPLKYSDII